jgi:hypothetical protein
MAVVRYDPAAAVTYSGSIGGSGAGSVSAAMAQGSDYPGAVDGNWFQTGGYSPSGPYVLVYNGGSIGPHASAFPAGKDIIAAEVAFLGQMPSGGGPTTTVILNNNNFSQSISAQKTWPDANPAWGRAVDTDFYIPAAAVSAYLASAQFLIYQAIPGGFPSRIDYFSMYVNFTVGQALEATIPVDLDINPTLNAMWSLEAHL